LIANSFPGLFRGTDSLWTFSILVSTVSFAAYVTLLRRERIAWTAKNLAGDIVAIAIFLVTLSREAYQLLLKAQYHVKKITPEGLQQGMAYAWQAIEADPRYAEAYAWLSVIYARLGFFSVAPAAAFPKAKAAALQALEIDDSLAEAHLALAVVRLFL
jgi:hypothetical protein